MKIMLSEGGIMPNRAHDWDGGLDLFSPCNVTIPKSQAVFHRDIITNEIVVDVRVGSAVIDTKTHVQIPEGTVGLLKSKSGLMVNHGLTTDGTIDAHYTGPIKVILFNHTNKDYHVMAGDKIAQLVIVPCLLPELELVDHLDETDRGDNGFGSTGR